MGAIATTGRAATRADVATVEPEAMSDFHTATFPKARKPHTCEECRLPVAIGDRYARHAGAFDGMGYALPLCLRCDALNNYAWKIARQIGCDGEDGPPFGGIVAWLVTVADEMAPVRAPPPQGFEVACLSKSVANTARLGLPGLGDNPEVAGHFAGLVFRMRENDAERQNQRARVT
jgi:hypothetical protein